MPHRCTIDSNHTGFVTITQKTDATVTHPMSGMGKGTCISMRANHKDFFALSGANTVGSVLPGVSSKKGLYSYDTFPKEPIYINGKQLLKEALGPWEPRSLPYLFSQQDRKQGSAPLTNVTRSPLDSALNTVIASKSKLLVVADSLQGNLSGYVLSHTSLAQTPG
ncbi:hypothetical protein Anapl_17473 [Anas platyrhynchos]|uniref:Uncharacterized protein n=1 Tax=Anas platyrhynchos TaxID=8839 RepID=R0JAU9_ANAPL|nr:hypothetical protein Anapl_17473 [Anas platyrhynchos]